MEVPPNGEIPMHDHNTDEFSSWVFCLEGYGDHVVEINGETYSHSVKRGDASVSTQKMSPPGPTPGALQYKHGFKAGPYNRQLWLPKPIQTTEGPTSTSTTGTTPSLEQPTLAVVEMGSTGTRGRRRGAVRCCTTAYCSN